MQQTMMRDPVEPPPAELEDVPCCPVCGQARRRALWTSGDWLHRIPGEFPLVRCYDCGLVYLSERPTKQALPRYYPEESYYAYRRPRPTTPFARRDLGALVWYAVKRSILAHELNYRHLKGSRLVSTLVRRCGLNAIRSRAAFGFEVLLHPYVEGGSLLEVGCGSGGYLQLMRTLGWRRTVGVDVNSRAIAHAKELDGIEAYCGELRDVGFAAESFDAVSLSHSLEHVADPVGLLGEIRRLLKPGGRLAIIVPNADGFCARRFRHFWLGFDPPRHLINFTRDSMSAAVKAARLHILELKTSPRGAYQVALYCHSRRAGDPHSVYTDSEHAFALSRRARARILAAAERMCVAEGYDFGEELLVVATRDDGCR